MENKRRVVITGLGVVSSIGIGKDLFWKGLVNGKSGISEVTSLDTAGFKHHYGGEVKEFDAGRFIPKRKIGFLGRASQLAVAASTLALSDAKIAHNEISGRRFGVIIGTTTGERPLEELLESWAKSGLKDIDRRKILQAAVNNISNNAGIQFKAMGLNYLIPTACAAGNYAIGYGFDLIREGGLDFVLAGGSDAFSRVAFTGFQRIYAMAPERCQPFDKNRKGMLLGEGAGILFLESLQSAIKRGSEIYAEIMGYGLSCDAYHATIPHPAGIIKAIEKALQESGLPYGSVDYVSAHGTGTAANDKAECQAIKEVFKERCREVAVSSIKSMLGHTMGAASAIEAISCCLAIKDGIIPPTINYETPDPECDIDCVPNAARKKKINVALNNAFAFGGNNSCLALKRYA